MSYILKLLAKLKDSTQEEQEKQKKAILDTISGENHLRSKRELIEKFIQENLPNIEDSNDIADEFYTFWNDERKQALEVLTEEEDLDFEKIQKLIGDYLFTEKEPLRDNLIEAINYRPALKERRSIAERISSKIRKYIETFIEGF